MSDDEPASEVSAPAALFSEEARAGAADEIHRSLHRVHPCFYAGLDPERCPELHRARRFADIALAAPAVRREVERRDEGLCLLAEELRRLAPEAERLRLAEVGSRGRDLAFVKEVERADRAVSEVRRLAAALEAAERRIAAALSLCDEADRTYGTGVNGDILDRAEVRTILTAGVPHSGDEEAEAPMPEVPQPPP